MKSSTVFVVGARGIPDVEGGAEKNAEMIFPLIKSAGYRVVLAGLAANVKSSEFKGVELWKAPESRLLKTDKLAYYIAALGMAMKLRPDIVHLQGLGSAIFLLIYKALGMKTVVRYGSADYLLDKWGFVGKLGFLLSEYQLRFADAVIAVTPALKDRLASRGCRRNVHVIANAVDFVAAPEADADDVDGAPYILAVGRVTAQKNIDNLIRGFAKFSERHPEYKLRIAGGLDDAPYVESLKPIMSDKVELMGRIPRSQLAPLYRGSTVYVNSSIHEGSSNAVLEAISCGCSVLLSNIPENRDFGLPIAQYFDHLDPDAICEALSCAASAPKDFLVDSNRFMSWPQVADATMRIYREELGVSV